MDFKIPIHVMLQHTEISICILAGMQTLDEIVVTLNLTNFEDMVHSHFQELGLFLARMDGFHGFRMVRHGVC